MSAPAAALVTFVAIVAIVVVVMAILFLVQRVRALKVTVQELSDTLDPALERLRRDTEVTRTELSGIQSSLEDLSRRA